MRTSLVTACLAALTAFTCATPTPTGPQALVHVEFTDLTLSPVTAQLTRGGNVHWVNRGEEVRGVVVLPASIRTSLACGDRVGPMFEKVDAGFASLPIEDFEARDVRLPCELAPGTYAYEIWIFGAGLGRVGTAPQNKLSGEIVVQLVCWAWGMTMLSKNRLPA